MKKTFLTLMMATASFLGKPHFVEASVLAIVDSGVDMFHEKIASFAWKNPFERPNNDRDEDRNGYQDDIFGWNFADDNSEVIDYSYDEYLTSEVMRFFQVQTDYYLGNATEEDLTWMREQIQDKEFVKKLSASANYIHGTHVSGIGLQKTDESQLLAVKLLPTEVKQPFMDLLLSDLEEESQNSGELDFEGGVKDYIIKKTLGFLAKQSGDQLEEVGDYLAGHKVDVANNSFGIGYAQVRGMFEGDYSLNYEMKDEYARYFLEVLLKENLRYVRASHDTLFIFAAGNDGLNNDLYPISPANLRTFNSLTVAATYKRQRLATFSNYGEEMVDLAAPGVAIYSAIPGNRYLRASGTSQAAPYVASVASKIKALNFMLDPMEIKKILMETVDVKDWLKGVVASSGMINAQRAIKAAEISLRYPLNEAIRWAVENVADVPVEEPEASSDHSGVSHMFQEEDLFYFPLPSPFKFNK